MLSIDHFPFFLYHEVGDHTIIKILLMLIGLLSSEILNVELLRLAITCYNDAKIICMYVSESTVVLSM